MTAPGPAYPISGPSWLVGMRNALILPAWLVSAALIGVGPLARDAGYPLGAAVVSTFAVWAGPAQVILFGMLGAGAAWPAIALAVCLSGVRLMPMTMSVLPVLAPARPSLPMQLLCTHLVTITVWIDSMVRLPRIAPEQRIAYFLGFAGTCISLSAAATGLGYIAAGIVPPSLGAALLLVSPIFFTLSLVDGARRLPDFLALGLGFLVTPLLLPYLGPGPALLVTGLVAGSLGYALHRRMRRP
jgi:predicted branched-subunit amino acid permease